MKKHIKKKQTKQGKKKFDCLLVNPPLCCDGCYEKTVAPMVPTQLVSLATTLRRNGFQANVLDLSIMEDARAVFNEIISELEPAAIGFSNHTVINLEVIEQLAQDAKESGAKVLLGGVNPTNMGAETLDFVPSVDHLFKGFSDTTLLEFLNNGKIERVIRALPESSGFPDEVPDIKMLSNLEHYTSSLYPIETQRGCELNCAFCTSRMGVPLMRRDPWLVVREITAAYRAGFREFFFTDNTFTSDKRYVKDLCEKIDFARKLEKMDIRLIAMTRFDCVDLEILKTMEHVGFESLGFGLETISQEVMKSYTFQSKVDGLKQFTDNWNKIDRLEKPDIEWTAFIIVGGPADTEESLEQTHEWLSTWGKLYKIDWVTASMFRPFPGTPYWRHPEKYGLEFDKSLEAFHDWGFFNGKAVSATKHLSKERIEHWAGKFNELNPKTPELQI
jgi:radical SAM superfamily enzyme YgiQ (UPF0313 family)